MSQPGILIVSGPSGSGKGTVIGSLPKNYKKAVSVTTRTPRPGETEGIDYFFISKERFQELLSSDNILEYNYYDGNYYGTPRSEITNTLCSGRNVICDVDVNGAMHIKKAYPEAVLVFLMPPDEATQIARLRGRNTNSEASIAARIAQTKVEFEFIPKFQCVIINEDNQIETTVNALIRASSGDFPDQSHIPEILKNYFKNN